LGINGSGIVLVMSATDWETRELESASRERLLAEIGVIHQSCEMEIEILRKALEEAHDASRIGELERHVNELQQQVSQLQESLMAAKDFAMGAASRAGEAQAQLSAQVGQLGAAQARIAFLSKHINRMRNSTTWELGHFIMLPVRVVKKITRRAS